MSSYSLLYCFQNMVYYKLSYVDGRITNPEQRITSDVPSFYSELSELVHDDLTAVTDGLLYRLCSYASPKYVLWILVICNLTVLLYIILPGSYWFVSYSVVADGWRLQEQILELVHAFFSINNCCIFRPMY